MRYISKIKNGIKETWNFIMSYLFKKKSGVGKMLAVIAIVLGVFCCDIPAWDRWEFMDHTGKDFLYDFSMACLTAIIFYFIQSIYCFYSVTLKYEKTVYNECQSIIKDMEEIFHMVTGKRAYEKVTKEEVYRRLETFDLQREGSGENLYNKELIVSEAAYRRTEQIKKKIDGLLAIPGIDRNICKCLYSLKYLEINGKWKEMYENQEGEAIETIKQKEGLSYGGVCIKVYSLNEIVDGIFKYIDIKRELNDILRDVYGYTK